MFVNRNNNGESQVETLVQGFGGNSRTAFWICAIAMSFNLVSCGNKNSTAAVPQPSPTPYWGPTASGVDGNLSAPGTGGTQVGRTVTPVGTRVAVGGEPQQVVSYTSPLPINPIYNATPVVGPYYDQCGNALTYIPGGSNPCGRTVVVQNCCTSYVVRCERVCIRPVVVATQTQVVKTVETVTSNTSGTTSDCSKTTDCQNTSQRTDETGTTTTHTHQDTEVPAGRENPKKEIQQGIKLCSDGDTSVAEALMAEGTVDRDVAGKVLTASLNSQLKDGKASLDLRFKVASLAGGKAKADGKEDAYYQATANPEVSAMKQVNFPDDNHFTDVTLKCFNVNGDLCGLAKLTFKVVFVSKSYPVVEIYFRSFKTCAIAPLSETGHAKADNSPQSYESFVNALSNIFADKNKAISGEVIQSATVQTFAVVGGRQGIKVSMISSKNAQQNVMQYIVSKSGDFKSPEGRAANFSYGTLTGDRIYLNGADGFFDINISDVNAKSFSLKVIDPNDSSNTATLKLGLIK